MFQSTALSRYLCALQTRSDSYVTLVTQCFQAILVDKECIPQRVESFSCCQWKTTIVPQCADGQHAHVTASRRRLVRKLKLNYAKEIAWGHNNWYAAAIGLQRKRNQYFILMFNRYTKFTKVLTNSSAIEVHVTNLTFNLWMVRYGIPGHVMKNNGNDFMRKLFATLCIVSLVIHLTAVAYYFHTNAEVKMDNRRLHLSTIAYLLCFFCSRRRGTGAGIRLYGALYYSDSGTILPRIDKTWTSTCNYYHMHIKQMRRILQGRQASAWY